MRPRPVLVSQEAAVIRATTITVCPILILSPFFSRCGAWIRRPFSQVPFFEPRSSTYQSPCATWNRAWWPEAKSSVIAGCPAARR